MNTHFIAIKHDGHSNTGESINSMQGIELLLKSGIWPLFERTRCKHMVEKGGKILAYAAGNKEGSGRVIAKADIKEVVPWSSKLERDYPLLMDGLPDKVLVLENCEILERPTVMREAIFKTSFAPSNTAKWGVCMMGGLRSLSREDFEILGGK